MSCSVSFLSFLLHLLYLSHSLERGKLWIEDIHKYFSIPRYIKKAEQHQKNTYNQWTHRLISHVNKLQTDTQTWVSHVNKLQTDTQTWISHINKLQTDTQTWVNHVNKLQTDRQTWISHVNKLQTDKHE